MSEQMDRENVREVDWKEGEVDTTHGHLPRFVIPIVVWNAIVRGRNWEANEAIQSVREVARKHRGGKPVAVYSPDGEFRWCENCCQYSGRGK